MEAILSENHVEICQEEAVIVLDPDRIVDIPENITDLGIWLSGLRSYLSTKPGRSNASSWDQLAATEFKVVHAGISESVISGSLILSDLHGLSELPNLGDGSLSASDLLDLHATLTDAALMSESFINSTVHGPGQWRAWSEWLGRRLDENPSYHKIVKFAEFAGSNYLPPQLLEIAAHPSAITPEHAELVLVLPRFALILRYLKVVNRMLSADRPLKSSLLIFARVNELVLDLTSYIGNRLDRFPDQEAELFATLDAASYTASIELKKVYSQELAGVGGIRPTPSIFARIETAYSLLNDGFQQILAGFMKVVDPKVEIFDLFPEFQEKLRQSVTLRSELWSTLQMVKSAEQTSEQELIERMRHALIAFRNGPMRYLFYKDTETVDRFIEEILVTNQNKDLVPILHRFGAFLETLFGQVTLRSVLEKHPFERPNN